MDILGINKLTTELRLLREQLKDNNLELNAQLKDMGIMLMAGDYFTYKRIKDGKKPIANKVVNKPNAVEISEDNPIPWKDIKHVSVDGNAKRKIKLYKK